MQIIADLHTHTLSATHAFNTLDEMAAKAAALGYAALAITDHGPAMPDAPHMWHFANQTALPLVLHGGTGIPDDQITKAISLGVAKINVNTECQLVFAEATRKYIEAGKDLEGKGYDPRKLLKPGADAIVEKVKEKMILFGSDGKAE